MKFLKKSGIVLVVLFLLYVIVSLFLPSEISVERDKDMKADKAAVFTLVNTMKNWELWSPWSKIDPNWKVTYTGPESGTGAGYEWVSEKSEVGTGKMFIHSSHPTDSVMLKLWMEGMDTSNTSFHFIQKGDVVNVKWKMKSDIGFFMRLFPGLLLDNMVGKKFEMGLNAIDSLAKTSHAAAPEGVAGISTFNRKYALSILDSCPERDLSFKIAKLYEKIQIEMGERAEIAGAPLCIYHSINPDNVVFEAVIGVNKDPGAIKNPNVKLISIDEKKVLVYNFYGSYSDIKIGYAKLADHLSSNNLKQNGNSIEEYVSDPMIETNPDKWLTKIYVPVD